MRDTEFGDRAYRYRVGFRKKIIFIPFLVIGGVALFSYIVMLLWNALIPDIFHLGVITFWQAAGLLILSKLLFGFGPGGRGGAAWKRHRMEKWQAMNPEDRQRFREHMRERCGKWGHRHDHFWDEPAGNEAKPAQEAPKPTE
jgi:hypothetical protein